MRILFLGTAAAEGYPGIFCNCDSCQQARQLGGKNRRYRSALLVNDDLLIDFGPDLLAAAQRFAKSLWNVTTGLVTHAHSDHFYPANLEMRADGFTGRRRPPTLHLYGPHEVAEMLQAEFPKLELHLEAHTVHAFNTWQSDGYTITAYHAWHAVEHLETLFYGIDDVQPGVSAGRALLYATDTGLFPEDTRQALLGRSFDVIVLEETMGVGKYEQHLGFESFVEQTAWIRENGLLRPGGRLVATHFSHSGNPLHEELEAFFKPRGVEAAYDGLEIDI